MKNAIFYLSSVLVALTLFLGFASCTNEELDVPEPEGYHTYRLIWNDDIVGFDSGTRSVVRETKDGECVYIIFKVGDKSVNGAAVYNNGEWSLNCFGSLVKDVPSSCSVWFMEGVDASHATTITLSPDVMVSADRDGSYTLIDDNRIRLSAHLQPETGRLRFKGDAGKKFTFSGVKYPSSFDVKTGAFTMSESPMELTIDESGYTPALYALPTEERMLNVSYGFQTYRMACESPILDAGKTGFLNLPTQTAHNAWELTMITAPTLSDVSVADVSDKSANVSATIVSLNNGTLREAGFVYGTSDTPTLEANGGMVKCSTTTLSATLTGLAPTTTYYVRAYAINEAGISYSPQTVKFETTATPVIPVLLTTGEPTDVTSKSAKVSASVTDKGGNTITECGICWSARTQPTVADYVVAATSVKDNFALMITNLQEKSVYYVRAYAKTETGYVYYGNEVSFTTLSKEVDIEIEDYDDNDDLWE